MKKALCGILFLSSISSLTHAVTYESTTAIGREVGVNQEKIIKCLVTIDVNNLDGTLSDISMTACTQKDIDQNICTTQNIFNKNAETIASKHFPGDLRLPLENEQVLLDFKKSKAISYINKYTKFTNNVIMFNSKIKTTGNLYFGKIRKKSSLNLKIDPINLLPLSINGKQIIESGVVITSPEKERSFECSNFKQL